MMTVFVSYGRENQEAVGSLARDLGALGHQIWFDQDLTGGRAWWDHLLGRIRECDVFVSALSPESLDSQACKDECSYAFKLGKNILPILVADGVRADLLPPALAQIQYIDYRRQDKNAVFAIMKAFNALPPARPIPDPPPAPPPAPVSYLGGLLEQITVSTPLPFGEQTALLVRLKQGLQDAKTGESARNLLRKLRARDDLFARVADEIDALLAADVASPRPAAVENPRPEPTPRAVRDSSAAFDPAPRDSSSARPASSPGRFVRLAKWLVALDEFREYNALQRGHWARLRERPSLTTAAQWLFGDKRQFVLRFRIFFKAVLLMFLLFLLMAILGSAVR